MRTTMILCLALALTASMAVRRGNASRAVQISNTSIADLSDGKLVYDRKCEACHFSTSTEKKIGPGLAGLMKRAKFRNGMTADDDHLRRVIERGGKDMPGFRDSLKERQIRDLIAYVKTF
ncbi:MAG: cytochrome c [Candidatus Acidiferrales bacterium]